MSLLGAVIGGIGTVILGTIAVLSLAAAYDFFRRTYTGFVSPTPAGQVDDGLVKVSGTVETDRPLDPAVADSESVMSLITLSRQEGLSGKAVGSWDEEKELLRAVPFDVVDDSGSVSVEHADDPHQSGYKGLTRNATVELDGNEAVPEAIDSAFTEPTADVDAFIEALDEEDDEEAAELADELRASRDEGDSASDVLEETSALRAGVPQKFEEQYLAPGDEVHVIGTASDGRITNESSTFQVLHESRSKFGLLKGAAGGVALLFVGIATGYGTVNWFMQTGRELLEVVAFIA